MVVVEEEIFLLQSPLGAFAKGVQDFRVLWVCLTMHFLELDVLKVAVAPEGTLERPFVRVVVLAMQSANAGAIADFRAIQVSSAFNTSLKG